jgi:hypothetical protein
MTVYDYTNGIWHEDGKVFRLNNSKKINARWRGKAFAELDESLQRKIRNTTIHSIIFEQKTPQDNKDSLFLIFERINTSGRSLNSQEIRNCIFQGELNRSIISLNNNSDWRILFGSHGPDPRMRDTEQITRVLAFYMGNVENDERDAIQLKSYLNEFMERNRSIEIPPDICEKLTKAFAWVKTNLTNNAFRTYNKKTNKYNIKFHPPLFDAIVMAAIKHIDETGSLQNNQNAVESKLSLLENDSFSRAITVRTTNIANIKERISLAKSSLFA